MHSSTTLAVKTAQARRARASSGYTQDLYDYALDELLRQPERDGDPEHLLGNALANGRKHLRRRRAIVTITAYGDPNDLATLADPGNDDAAPLLDEALDWLRRAPLNRTEKLVLSTAASAEFGPGERSTGGPGAQQRLSRARASARVARVGFAW